MTATERRTQTLTDHHRRPDGRRWTVTAHWPQYPAALPTYWGWRWVCPACQAWGRTETRWGARRALKRHQRTCHAPRIIWGRMDLYTGRGL